MPDLKKPLQLLDYRLLEIRVKATPLSGESEVKDDLNLEPKVEFEVGQNPENLNVWMLQMSVDISQSDGDSFELEVYCEVLGIFEFPEEYTETEEMHRAVVLNGGTILYGIMRGLLSMISGVSVNGPYILPAIYMGQIAAEKFKSDKKQDDAGKPKQKTKKAATTHK